MAINPMQILKLKDSLQAFRGRHPGFTRFIGALHRDGLPDSSVIDVKVTLPDGRSMATNFRLAPEDIELIRLLGDLRK